MDRLRCGAIVSSLFIQHIENLSLQEQARYPDELIRIEFTRCIAGPRKGQAWLRTSWTERKRTPDHMIFPVGSVFIALPPKTCQALKNSFIDIKDGQVVVT